MVIDIEQRAGREEWVLTFDLGRFPQAGRRVVVTGSFSGWATDLRRARNGFVAAGRRDSFVRLALPAGVYEYKYYDLAAGEWLEVERHAELYRGYYWDYVRNPFGTLNCIVRVPGAEGSGRK